MTTALLLHCADGALPIAAFHKAGLGPADPFAREREIAWEGPGAMSAGRVSFVGELGVTIYPHIETLVVLDGELSLTVPGVAPLLLSAGEGAVIAFGTQLRIQAIAPTRFVFCAAAPAAPTGHGQRGITRLRADADFKPSSPPPAEVLLGSTPQCRSDNVFTDEATDFRAGTWDSTPYTASCGRIASTSSCSCWPGAFGSRARTAACWRPMQAMRSSFLEAPRSAGRAASASPSSMSCRT
ncbi:MAG TPA: hypothetical protein VFE12_09300 [Acetobacteraceae bacterium]|nr:hypothetical protein [Acetobacteraceae bacterium]